MKGGSCQFNTYNKLTNGSCFSSALNNRADSRLAPLTSKQLVLFPLQAMVIEKHKIDPENTILEITESGLIQELSSTLDVLTRLRLKRVQLSIDDFGTGYSMMQQLRHIPATELKIDKSFVQTCTTPIATA